MFSLAGTVGSDEDMLNAGLSIKFGPGTAGKSRAELTKQVAEMQEQNAKLAQEVQTMKQALYALVGMVDMTKVKEMPDVPQDHWAKDAVDHLAGNGVIEGYPDGTFKGDKTMTRYEIAEMLYKALQKALSRSSNAQRIRTGAGSASRPAQIVPVHAYVYQIMLNRHN